VLEIVNLTGDTCEGCMSARGYGSAEAPGIREKRSLEIIDLTGATCETFISAHGTRTAGGHESRPEQPRVSTGATTASTSSSSFRPNDVAPERCVGDLRNQEQGQGRPGPIRVDGHDERFVEEVCHLRGSAAEESLEYLIKWQGWLEFTWEPASHLINCGARLAAFYGQSLQVPELERHHRLSAGTAFEP